MLCNVYADAVVAVDINVLAESAVAKRNLAANAVAISAGAV